MTTRSRAPEKPPDFRATNKMTQLGAKLTMGVGNTDTSIKMRQINLSIFKEVSHPHPILAMRASSSSPVV